MNRGFLLLAGVFLAMACDGGGGASPTSTSTAVTTPRPSPTAEIEMSPYDAFARELELALTSNDVSWFVDNMTDRLPCSALGEWVTECRGVPPDTRVSTIQVQHLLGAASVIGEGDFRDAIEEIFGRVDGSARDRYGTGAPSLYAVGDQQLPAGLLIAHFMATAILDGAEPARWVLVWRAERTRLEPGQWELTRMVLVPPERVDDALAFEPLADTSLNPLAYPEGFADALAAIEQAVADADSEGLTSQMAFRPYTCPETPPAITAVPSCVGQQAGTSVDTVSWQVYCTACDPHGFATEEELLSWLDRLFSGSAGTGPDPLGSAEFRVALVAASPFGPSFDVTITGISEVEQLTGLTRESGRWLFTLTMSEISGEWKATSLTFGAPGVSDWMLPTLLGTNITWTRWPTID